MKIICDYFFFLYIILTSLCDLKIKVSWPKWLGHAMWLSRFSFSRNSGRHIVKDMESESGLASLLKWDFLLYKWRQGTLPHCVWMKCKRLLLFFFFFPSFYKASLCSPGCNQTRCVPQACTWDPPVPTAPCWDERCTGPTPAGLDDLVPGKPNAISRALVILAIFLPFSNNDDDNNF